jgi:hypothetical protein
VIGLYRDVVRKVVRITGGGLRANVNGEKELEEVRIRRKQWPLRDENVQLQEENLKVNKDGPFQGHSGWKLGKKW